ncbi:MAG TPA: translocation/assembly module TamB domain-containing protein [Gemmatimonadaceae bacterium]|nr:translocation/assembly module TamB domain-containing protein [Gemmatimonadaceae bacterium]
MTRRRLVAAASAIALLAIGLVLALAFVTVTQTPFGRERVRRLIMSYTSHARGKVYIGHLGGGLLTGVTIDSLEMREPDGELFLATGKVTVAYDPRDFLDRRILLSHVEVEHPVVIMRRHADGSWNWRKIFPEGPKGPKRTEPGFGDFIVIDSAVVHDGAFTLTLPWAPDDSLHGARRDSAVAFNLARKDKIIRRDADGLHHTWRWTHIDAISPYIRIADSDSAGRYFAVSKLDLSEFDPPFEFRNVRGGVKHMGDSIWLDLPHFDLPGSTGRARGKVVWGSDLPIRYAIDVTGDSVALKDVAWVYPTLPTTGGGKMHLQIRNEPSNLGVIDYAIRDMDVRSVKSRLRGNMTFGVGGPVLIVKDVAMDAQPLDFDLIRTLNGKPFPYDWRGQITGNVVARGGPLTRFKVDSARFVFRDAHVPGAVSSGTGRGELDILFPAFTAFHHFAVTTDRLDLRTIEFLNPNFPRLGGTVAGRATLDSSWLDVRFSDADLTHTDGPAEPTHMTGRGRVTYGEQFMTYDLDLDAQPLSLTTLARSYPTMTLRGPLRGPMRVKGTIENLELATTLAGPAGAVAVSGHFDLFPPQFAMRGAGSVTNIDLAQLVALPPPSKPGAAPLRVPSTDLTGDFDVDITGDSLSNLRGPVGLTLRRSRVDSVRVYGAQTRLHFDAGAVRADTLTVETALGALRASGGLGLIPSRRDSLRYVVTVDSLGGFRQLAASGAKPSTSVPDSLAGSLTLSGVVAGSLDTLAARGELAARDLVIGTAAAHGATGGFTLFDLRGAPSGSASLALDTLSVAGVALRRFAVEARVADRAHGGFSLAAESQSGPRLNVAGRVALVADTAAVTLDTLGLVAGDDRWALGAPAVVRSNPLGVSFDQIALIGTSGGRVEFGGALPSSGPVSLMLRADSVPLADLSALAQSSVPYSGRVAFDWRAEGTREAPLMKWTASLRDAHFGGLALDYVAATGAYADHRADASVDLYRGGRPVVSARGKLPLDLSLVPVEQRLLESAPLEASVRTDSADLSVLEALTPAVQRASGQVQAQVDVAGTWKRPRFTGLFSIGDGALSLPNAGVRLTRITADVGLSGDSVAVRKVQAYTTGARTGWATLTGGATIEELANPTLDLTLEARNFHVIDRARVADLELSTVRGNPLHLAGSSRRSTLTGGVEIARGDIYIPEIATKKVVSLDDPELYKVVDTSLYTNRTLLPGAPPEFVRNLSVQGVQIDMGSDTWLRSSEANVNLGGAVSVTTSRNERDRDKVQFALDGVLRADRGTYRLNLGVVQRTFTIEGGTLRFYGTDPDLNPELAITAVHTVRQYEQSSDAKREIRIRVKIGGTLAQPTLELSSDDSRLQQSDLLSYLITGQPSFEIGGNASGGGTGSTVGSTLASVALPTFSSYLEGRFSGKLFDYVQLQSAGVDRSATASLTQVGSLLDRTRLGLGIQIGDRTFVSATFGLCQFGSVLTKGQQGLNNFDPATLANSAGGKVEYRFDRGLSAAFGLEPSTSALLCSTQATSRTFVPTPRQLGFDLFKTWQF